MKRDKNKITTHESTIIYPTNYFPNYSQLNTIITRQFSSFPFSLSPPFFFFSSSFHLSLFLPSQPKHSAKVYAFYQYFQNNSFLLILAFHKERHWFYVGCKSCCSTATPYFNPVTEEIEANKYSCYICEKNEITTSIW